MNIPNGLCLQKTPTGRWAIRHRSGLLVVRREFDSIAEAEWCIRESGASNIDWMLMPKELYAQYSLVIDNVLELLNTLKPNASRR